MNKVLELCDYWGEGCFRQRESMQRYSSGGAGAVFAGRGGQGSCSGIRRKQMVGEEVEEVAGDQLTEGYRS